MRNRIPGNTVKNWEQIRSRFAGSGLCACNYIGSIQNQRNYLLLDRSCSFEAHGIEPVNKRSAEIKIVECQGEKVQLHISSILPAYFKKGIGDLSERTIFGC